MSIKASNQEWVVILSGLILIIIGGIYCTWRIQMLQANLIEHRVYINHRDKLWEPLIERIENHLTSQDRDGIKLRKDDDTRMLLLATKTNQEIMIKNQEKIMSSLMDVAHKNQ